MAARKVSEAELECLFRKDPRAAIEYLDKKFRHQIACYIKRVTWGLLKPDDLNDAYQETLTALIAKIRKRGFDPTRPLRLVYEIARNKGIDAMRRQGHRVRTDTNRLFEGLADLSAGNSGGVTTALELQELRSCLEQVILTLPDQQRLVARVFVDNFEDFGPRDIYSKLTGAVNKTLGPQERLSEQAVKSAWREARTKLAAGLRHRGYDPAERSAVCSE